MKPFDANRIVTPAVLLALTLAVGGCSTSALNLDSMNMFGSSSAKSASASTASGAAGTEEETIDDCPDVTVRVGASTLSVAGKAADSKDPAVLDLRYQGSIVRTARECHPKAGTMTMKVGIEGRIVLGPAGGPGQLDVPLRLAVVQEGPQPKTILSKLVHVPVTIAPDQDRANFTHIDPEVVFPVPRPASTLESYVVYVGFDPNAALPVKPKATAKPRKR